MTNKELKKDLTFLLQMAVYGSEIQKDPNGLANDIIVELQKQHLFKMQEFINSIPDEKDKVFTLEWKENARV